MKRRVVVTGIGAITPIGLGRDGLWEGILAERSAVGPVTRFDPSQFRSHVAAEVNDFGQAVRASASRSSSPSEGHSVMSDIGAGKPIEPATSTRFHTNIEKLNRSYWFATALRPSPG